MTKVHEEFRRGRLRELASGLEERPVKGEITLVVEGVGEIQPVARPEVELRREVEEAVGRGLSRRDAVRIVAQRYSLPRREVYRISRPELGKRSRPPSQDEE
jgi:16S rRNA (cytidine1402-2'-O)-methyltransferase